MRCSRCPPGCRSSFSLGEETVRASGRRTGSSSTSRATASRRSRRCSMLRGERRSTRPKAICSRTTCSCWSAIFRICRPRTGRSSLGRSRPCWAPASRRQPIGWPKPAGHIDLTLMERVRQAVRRNLRSPSLGPDKLCREAATSRSQLYRLLEGEGGVAHYIQRRRLSESFSMLCDVSKQFPDRQGRRDAVLRRRLELQPRVSAGIRHESERRAGPLSRRRTADDATEEFLQGPVSTVSASACAACNAGLAFTGASAACRPLLAPRGRSR